MHGPFCRLLGQQQFVFIHRAVSFVLHGVVFHGVVLDGVVFDGLIFNGFVLYDDIFLYGFFRNSRTPNHA